MHYDKIIMQKCDFWPKKLGFQGQKQWPPKFLGLPTSGVIWGRSGVTLVILECRITVRD